MRVVPALDEVEDGHSGLGLVLEAVLFGELALEGGEEALAEPVVLGVPDGAHRGTDPGMLVPEAEGNGSLGTPLAWCRMTPRGRRCSTAMSRALRTSSVFRCVCMDQPTTLRLQASTTTAR